MSLPSQMTAIAIRAPGGPEMLVPEDRPVATLGQGEVMVRVLAAGVNRPDVVQRMGHYPPPKGATDIPGLEIAGEVVALVLPNSIEFHIAYFAALKALAVPALLNPLYPAVQLSPLLLEASPRAVLCAPATRDMVAGLADDLGIPGVVCLGQDITIRELVAEPEAPLRLRTATPTDAGALLFSGGTTGLPKAVEHTHDRLAAAKRNLQGRPSGCNTLHRQTGHEMMAFQAGAGHVVPDAGYLSADNAEQLTRSTALMASWG